MLVNLQEQAQALQALRAQLLLRLYPQFKAVPAMAASKFKRDYP
jgi:hypothetical protein